MIIKKELVQPLGNHNPKYECVRTDGLKDLIEYSYSHFNPMQSDFIDHLQDINKNIIISASTGAGKTTVAELSIAMNLFYYKGKKKAIFLAPMKSLTEQKLREWKDEKHTFSKYKIGVLTGDYALNKSKMKELEECDIILCTSEMLDSKTRNYESNKWLHNVGVLIVDEVHLLGAEERGPRLETAIMRFTECNNDCRIILMSGTIPNADELYNWVCNLTGKPTELIISNYRPCQLKKHFLEFNDGISNRRNKYSEIENMRMQVVYNQILKNKNEQHIVFVGNKSFGRNMTQMLNANGLKAEFHNADIAQEKKIEIEDDFNSGKLKYLVSSSTLAWGVNLNARIVILAHTSYGLSEMDVADIDQACGRAGRAQYHSEGDAYIILPSSKSYSERKRITSGFTIQSKLKDQKVLAFHVVSEIASGKINNVNDLFEWYKRSFAYSQNYELTEDDCMMLLNRLKNIKMIKLEDDKCTITALGQIASQMYQNPFDVFDWYKNFSYLQYIGIPYNEENKAEVEEIDLQVCWALANINSYQESSGAFISAAEKESDMVCSIARRVGKMVPATKVAACYWYMLKGEEPDDVLRSLYYALYTDFQRVLFTLQLIHIKYASYLANKTDYIVGWKYDSNEWDKLFLRMKYGVNRNKVYLVSLPEIGKTYADKLFAAGVRSKNDLLSKRITVEEVLGKKRAEKIYSYLEKR